MLREIKLPITVPERPDYGHALLQRRIGAWLGAWVEESKLGRVGTDWLFRVAPPGEIVRPLVPDISYLSYDSLPEGEPYDELQMPLGAPTVAFEILSPDDRQRNVESEIRTLLAAGTQAVVVIDPRHGTVTVHDPSGANTYAVPDRAGHASMPGFSIDLRRLFADMD